MGLAMQWKNNKGGEEKLPLTTALESPEPTASSADGVSTVTQFDFRGEEFNSTDDLDDNIGNYREFEPLDGIVTADMKFHRKRRKNKRINEAEEDVADAVACPPPTIRENHDETFGPLTVISQGRLLILADNLEQALASAEKLHDVKIECTLCIPNANGKDPQVSSINGFPVIAADKVAVSGCFGSFTVTVKDSDDSTGNLSILAGHDYDNFDIVLDLQFSPDNKNKTSPLGYYAPGGDASSVALALAEIPEMRGRFQRPQFSRWRMERCLHGRMKSTECRTCIDTCPTSAVTSHQAALHLDPYRCDGCGSCALVCPTEAFEMLSPTQEEFLLKIIGQLSEARAKNRQITEVILCDGGVDTAVIHRSLSGKGEVLVLRIEEIGRIGAEALLSLFVCGARGVTLLCADNKSTALTKAVKNQVEFTDLILRKLEIPSLSLRFLKGSADSLAAAIVERSPPGTSNTDFLTNSSHVPPYPLSLGRRAIIRRAAQVLGEMYNCEKTSIDLPTGSIFGTINVDKSCSLCMACVSICPGGALRAESDTPRLAIVESDCHQCGLCAAVCPEEAISLHPRLLCSQDAAEKETILHEEEPFTCIMCGRPFASQAMISRIQEKLGDHWMYLSEKQKRRLQMCGGCRTGDALVAGDYHR